MSTAHEPLGGPQDPASPVSRVEKIWLKRARLLPMDEVEQAEADTGRGLRANANRGGKRQVTLISTEAWEQVETTLGQSLNPALRRANILISGVDLEKSRGKLLQIGEVQIRIWGETVPCRAMEEAHPGLQEALRPHWRGGAFGEVIQGGLVTVGEPVFWLES